jgi:hypothetical protein
LHVKVVVVSGRLNIEIQTLGQGEHRVLAHDVGPCNGVASTPPTEDRFHTQACSSVAIIFGR